MEWLEHPDISRALRTGYGDTDVAYYETEQVYYLTDDGEMTEKEVIEYMLEYVNSNPDDAAEAFGIERRTRMVLCDAYGDPYE